MTEQPAEPAAVEKDAVEAKISELDILRQSLQAAQAKSADYYDQLLRLKAEFENFRKRTEKDRADSRRWGKEEIVLRLVSLMDVMELAEAAAHKSPDVKSMVQGLDMLYGEFKRLLKEEGLEEIPTAVGDAYNHAAHEAVETIEDKEDGKILAVLQKGYKFQGGLFRLAREISGIGVDRGRVAVERPALAGVGVRPASAPNLDADVGAADVDRRRVEAGNGSGSDRAHGHPRRCRSASAILAIAARRDKPSGRCRSVPSPNRHSTPHTSASIRSDGCRRPSAGR